MIQTSLTIILVLFSIPTMFLYGDTRLDKTQSVEIEKVERSDRDRSNEFAGRVEVGSKVDDILKLVKSISLFQSQ